MRLLEFLAIAISFAESPKNNPTIICRSDLVSRLLDLALIKAWSVGLLCVVGVGVGVRGCVCVSMHVASVSVSGPCSARACARAILRVRMRACTRVL